MGPGTVVSNLDPFIKIAMKYAAVCPLNIILGDLPSFLNHKIYTLCIKGWQFGIGVKKGKYM